MKNYKLYIIALLILSFTACSTTYEEVENHPPFPVDNQVPNCAADGPGCKQLNEDSIRPCTREYRPVCGEIQIECVTTPCTPIMKTFSNACVLSNNKRAKFLYKGVCR